jgi:serine/threonine-protein kinase
MDRSVEMPASLNQKLLNTLRTCGDTFDDDRTLRNLFIDDHLAPWRDKIPTSHTKATRIANLIALLYNQTNEKYKRNALVLFLERLQQNHHPDDSCAHRLRQLANEWQSVIYGEPDWVKIPEGTFWMGSEEIDIEKPIHQVHLDTYHIARYPTTNAQYAIFTHDTSYQTPKHWENGIMPSLLHNHPVVNVSWHDALAYCQWLCQATGKNIALPSEAQWEKAARGTDRRRYPWGNDFDKGKANTWENDIRTTTPVNAYPAGKSPYGVWDMSGNVWEWTSTLFRNYPYNASDGRENLNEGDWRIVRGGSWGLAHVNARASSRLNYDPDLRSSDFGFRLVVRRPPSHLVP